MSAPAELKPVNSELVAVAWAQGISGIPAGKVARTLPPEAQWADTGFVVATIVGGSPNQNAPLSAPVIQFDCWAARGESATTPPWGVAFILAERIKRACEVDSPNRSAVLTIPHGFEQALVQDASAITEPRRHPVPSPAGYAHVIQDVQLMWTRYNPEEY